MNYLLYLVFLVGQALHLLGRAHKSVLSALTADVTIGGWFKRNWPTALFHTFACSMLFLAWATPLLDKLLLACGLTNLTGLFPLPTAVSPQTLMIAGLCGLGADWALTWLVARFVPGLESEIPAYNATVGIKKILEEKGISQNSEKE